MEFEVLNKAQMNKKLEVGKAELGYVGNVEINPYNTALMPLQELSEDYLPMTLKAL